MKQDKPTVKIDWLTFTVWRNLSTTESYERSTLDSLHNIVEFMRSVGVEFEFVPTGKSRRPYTDSYKSLGHSCVLMTNKSLEYATLEFTGQGCSQLIRDKVMNKVVNYMVQNGQKCTRFDVAVDFKVDDSPMQFVQAGYSDRIKSFGHNKTSTGETVYLGSPKSDRMVRVYKYNKPHPRAGLLRVELVGRRKVAQDALEIWYQDGPNAAVAYLAKSYKFEAKLWQDVELDLWTVETATEGLRSDGKTITWLLSQVKSALVKLALADKLSPVFWHEFFGGIPNISVTYTNDDSGNASEDAPFK